MFSHPVAPSVDTLHRHNLFVLINKSKLIFKNQLSLFFTHTFFFQLAPNILVAVHTGHPTMHNHLTSLSASWLSVSRIFGFDALDCLDSFETCCGLVDFPFVEVVF